VKVFFDTSVLVAAMVDQLAQHERAFSYYAAALDAGHCCACSTHVLAECYATLTALPLPRRVQPEEARLLIEKNILEKLIVIELRMEDYREALGRVAALGLRSGVVYDALHLACAEKAGYKTMVTFNARDFERLEPKRIKVIVP
jgi:predicted nucleic acid-binding protein